MRAPLSRAVSAAVRLGSCTYPDPGSCGERIAELAELDATVASERRDDFIRGRVAARGALAGLGVRVASIPIGAWRQPVWPAGVVGSISHSAGVGVAVAARAADLRGVGVDVEASDRRLSPAVARRILSRPEHWAREDADMPWPLVLFCAKEAAFKAVFQAYGRRLVPGDLAFAEPAAAARSGSLECVIQRPGRRIRARYALGEGFLLACVELTRDAATAPVRADAEEA